jgi:molybdopterin synthase sulfur carrier subunit
MSVTVRIPTQLRELSGGNAEVTADGATVADVLKDLEAKHAGFQERLFDDAGELRRFVNVFVADEDIRFLDGVATPVADGATVSIIPAVAGGS